jgi:hypothetical protein
MWTKRLEKHAQWMRSGRRRRGHGGDGGAKASEARRAAGDRLRASQIVVTTVEMPSLPLEIEPAALPPRQRLGRPKGSRTIPSEAYPICPRCDGSSVIRRGRAHGIQRYRCKACSTTFSGAGVVVQKEPSPELLCYRCGETARIKSLGRALNSGWSGWCGRCGRQFTQGGRNELARYHLLLERRIAELSLPADVEEELRQMAYVDVIRGEGYCWTVPLRKADAFKAVRGNWQTVGAVKRYQLITEGRANDNNGDNRSG